MADEDVVTTIDALCARSTCKNADTYTVRVTCSNCGFQGAVRVTRGHEFSKYSRGCPTCGCSTLMRAPR